MGPTPVRAPSLSDAVHHAAGLPGWPSPGLLDRKGVFRLSSDGESVFKCSTDTQGARVRARAPQLANPTATANRSLRKEAYHRHPWPSSTPSHRRFHIPATGLSRQRYREPRAQVYQHCPGGGDFEPRRGSARRCRVEQLGHRRAESPSDAHFFGRKLFGEHTEPIVVSLSSELLQSAQVLGAIRGELVSRNSQVAKLAPRWQCGALPRLP